MTPLIKVTSHLNSFATDVLHEPQCSVADNLAQSDYSKVVLLTTCGFAASQVVATMSSSPDAKVQHS